MIIDGFSYAAFEAGIRKKGRLDLGLIVSETPATAAGVFTTNKVKAAPVLLDIERLRTGQAQGVLINSGIANACTGAQGVEAAATCARLAAAELGIPEAMVQVASTGVIGQQLDVTRFETAMAALVGRLSPTAFDDVARAMMTTDTVPKTAGRTAVIDGRQVRIFGMTKGAGMIMPNMATMLCFVMTDVAIEGAILQEMLKNAVDSSFNRITIDGDTSTNDMVLVLANGRAGNHILGPENGLGVQIFRTELDDLLKDLAMQIVADGEGVTKLVTIRVVGAVDNAQAEDAARTIANSPLVKTAFFGEDANWGRIIAALGRSGADFDQGKVAIAFDNVVMVSDGMGQGMEAETRATEIMKKSRFTVTVNLNAGAGACDYFTCDFSLDYVRINADYRS